MDRRRGRPESASTRVVRFRMKVKGGGEHCYRFRHGCLHATGWREQPIEKVRGIDCSEVCFFAAAAQSAGSERSDLGRWPTARVHAQ